MHRLIRHVLRLALVAALVGSAVASYAQLSEEAIVQMAPEQRQRLQALLDEPIEPGLSNLRLSEIYNRKSNIALALGNAAERERYLREWARIDLVGKRILRGALSGTDKHDEAIALGEELVRSGAGGLIPLLDVRANLTRDYTLVGRMAEAKAQIDAAESLVRGDLSRMSLAGDNLFYSRRVLSLFHGTKSLTQRLSGQWAEGIVQAKLSVDRAMEMLELRNTIRNEGARLEAISVVIRAYIDLSRIQTDAGLYADAEWTLREAFRQARKAEIDEARLWTLFRFVAEFYAASGQYNDALVFVSRAVVHSEAQGYSRASSVRRALETIRMQALIGLSRWDEAARVLAELDAAQVRQQAPEATINVSELRVRTRLALQAGDLARAAALLEPSLARNERLLGADHYFTSLDRGQLAVLRARQGRADEARAQFAQAVRGLTTPASLTGDFSENAFQRQTKRFILQSYMQLLATTAKDNPQDAVALFEVADQLTSSSVQQALAEAAVRSGVTQPALAEIIRKEQDAKQEIASLSNYLTGQGDGRQQGGQAAEQVRSRIRELEALRRGYKAQIQKDFPEYFALVQPRPPSPAEIARQLRPGELFLAVTPMTDTTYVWAIDAQGQVSFHDAGLGEAALGALVAKVRRTLDIGGFDNGRIPAFAFDEASRIYQAIFAPFDARIAGKQQLIVATGGSLAQLPFAVLPRQAHAGGLAEAPWLLKDVAVSHVPSANGWLALKRLQQVPVAAEPFMAWGDPVFDPRRNTSGGGSGLGAGWLLAAAPSSAPITDSPAPWPPLAAAATGPLRQVPPAAAGAAAQRNVLEADNYVVYSRIPALPETRDEVQALARILGADPGRDLVLGARATRQSVLDASKAGTLARKRVVVFATHGLLAGDLPNLNQPALAMAANADANASPLLTLEDVLGLKLNADWVVLSACNTAGADGRAQEAMSGLARGFFYAGSRSLLVTHWSVESQSAMLLTTNTFEAYAKDPAITRAEALRQAMLKVMASKDYQHPAFWAPYALVGEGGR